MPLTCTVGEHQPPGRRAEVSETAARRAVHGRPAGLTLQKAPEYVVGPAPEPVEGLVVVCVRFLRTQQRAESQCRSLAWWLFLSVLCGVGGGGCRVWFRYSDVQLVFVGCLSGVGAQQLSFSGRQRLFEDLSAFGLVVIVHQWRV